MSNGERCKECRQWIAANEMQCSCGWKAKGLVIETPVVADHGCRYQSKNKGRRCRLPGNMSSSTHKSDNWYCMGHYHSLGNTKEGEKWFEYVESHYEEIIEALKSWRNNLHQDYKSIIFREK